MSPSRNCQSRAGARGDRGRGLDALGMACLFWVTRRGIGPAISTPPVTIFKPLKGLDEGLEQNLRSFFRLDYPRFQLIFCVAERDDPAIEVVRKLQREFPDRDSQLVVGCPAFGLNPKVESLAAMDRHRKHDVILISDSNVRVGRPISARRPAIWPSRASGWSPTCSPGWVKCTPSAVHGEPAAERLHRRRAWPAAAVCGATCVVGKSMLMPVRALEAIGGFAAVRNVLAEDQVIGDPRPQGRLLDPPEPSRHRKRQPPAEASGGS